MKRWGVALAVMATCLGSAPSVHAAVDSEGRWFPSIGDPTFVGWFTLTLYVVAAALAARNIAAARRAAVPWSFWVVLGVLMFGLGINKQLDLQTWFGITGRQLAIEQGWYGERRLVQGVFIALLCAGTLWALWAARRRWVATWGEYRVAFVGVCLLCVFIVVRAATFHHVDRVLRLELGATRLSALLEITGVLVVAAGCAGWHRMHRRRVRRYFMQQALRR